MIADPDKLRAELVKLAEACLPGNVKSVEVEPSSTDDGYAFLKVIITLKAGDHDDDDLANLLESIEKEVARWDERYPSVRFQDAA